jgi:putative transposase
LPINYSWTKKGQQKRINDTEDKDIKANVLGLYDYNKKELAYSLTKETMDSEMFISLFDITKPEDDVPICVVIDNCSIHTSNMTKNKIIEWAKEGIFLYYLPTHSPELNLIEGRWNHLKYHCMSKRSFDNQNDLETAINEGITKLNFKT